MSTPVVQVLTKKGRFSKWFNRRAAALTRSVYATQFGGPVVSKGMVQNDNVVHVVYIQAEDGTTVAASMVIYNKRGFYRVHGLAVETEHKRKGYGTALMNKIMEIMPHRSDLILGVDIGKAETDWLLEWYTKLGFQVIDETYDEILMHKTFFKSD